MKSRRITQTLALVALHSSLWGQELKWLCTPVLSCHSCALAWFACPIGIFVHYAGWHAFPFIAMGTVLLVGALAGRILCGWVCPFGFIQDLLYKIPSPKFVLPRWTSWIKYPVLILSVVALPFIFGEGTWLSFCRICPASALQVTVPNQIASGFAGFTPATGIKLGFLAFVLGLAVFSSRGFCRAICPIGAILAPLNLVAFWRMKAPTDSCRLCGRCDKVCPVNGKPSERVSARVPANQATDCIVCHECQKVCPHKGAEAPPEADLSRDDAEDLSDVVGVASRLVGRG